MSISPQAKSVLDRLQAGETVFSSSGAVTLGPLDEPARLLLRVLTDHQRDLQQRTEADHVAALRWLYASEKEAGTPAEAEHDAAAPAKVGEPGIGDEAEDSSVLDESAGNSDTDSSGGKARTAVVEGHVPIHSGCSSRRRGLPIPFRRPIHVDLRAERKWQKQPSGGDRVGSDGSRFPRHGETWRIRACFHEETRVSYD